MHLVAQLHADHAGGDIFVERLMRVMAETGAMRAGVAGIFNQLERGIGIADLHAAHFGHHRRLRPALAGRRGDRGDWLARQAAGGIVIRTAGGKRQDKRGGKSGKGNAAKLRHGFFLS